MRYLSIDIEATGLESHDLIIEFAAVPVDATTKSVEESLSFHRFVQCPSFEELKPSLNPWVIENNESLIKKAHSEGLPLSKFKEDLAKYLLDPKIKKYFNNKTIVLLGKSLSAIDLPFLNRDLGQEFMREHFSHRNIDVTSATYTLIDAGKLPEKAESGSELMKFFKMGEVAHTALEDAVNTAELYFKMLKLID